MPKAKVAAGWLFEDLYAAPPAPPDPALEEPPADEPPELDEPPEPPGEALSLPVAAPESEEAGTGMAEPPPVPREPEAAEDPDVGSSAAPAFSLWGHDLLGPRPEPKAGPLAERFRWPPFTVFDARSGPWQDRKRAWLSLGLQSEVGRGDNLLNLSPHVQFQRATGIKYSEARELVAAAMAEQGEAFDLDALILKHGGKDRASFSQAPTALSAKLAPGGGGGGCWLGGPRTSSSDKYIETATLPPKSDGTLRTVGVSIGAYQNAGKPASASSGSGTSIFDPVLTELLYHWFCPPGGFALDPFAGGSVRGIVAAKLGVQYCGVELRSEQLDANEQQAAAICADDAARPQWAEGDAKDVRSIFDGLAFDFLIACPPYFDLEQYSEDPRDLSNMPWAGFKAAYMQIIEASVAMLKPDRFAAFVVGDIRCAEGLYRGFPELTVAAFEAAGAKKYNEAILVTSVGSLPVRVGRQFDAARKLGKTHQNVLVFCKGNPRRAAEACNGQLELEE